MTTKAADEYAYIAQRERELADERTKALQAVCSICHGTGRYLLFDRASTALCPCSGGSPVSVT